MRHLKYFIKTESVIPVHESERSSHSEGVPWVNEKASTCETTRKMATNATKENEKGNIGERNERQRAMPGIKEREAVSV